ncbi:MAG: Veg family protein [Actinomycetia bacterium]|nr:Veg family protein [Actinomycetes bacterium]
MVEVDLFQVKAIKKIKEDMRSFVGIKMRFKTNLGRCRIMEKEGTLEETHPNLFVIKVEEDRPRRRRISYSYVDVLTKTVELSSPSGENLFPWLN